MGGSLLLLSLRLSVLRRHDDVVDEKTKVDKTKADNRHETG